RLTMPISQNRENVIINNFQQLIDQKNNDIQQLQDINIKNEQRIAQKNNDIQQLQDINIKNEQRIAHLENQIQRSQGTYTLYFESFLTSNVLESTWMYAPIIFIVPMAIYLFRVRK
ncbi:unnamed protein product, partial [Rotaria socialis]